jgi:hypothetical protein
MPDPFIFTDESGVVETDPTQPFFGIGLLKLTRVGRWNHDLNQILDRAISAQAAAGGGKGRRFEFKFNGLHRANYPHYEKLIDYFLAQPDAYFNAFVVNKDEPGVNINRVYPESWDALLGYSYQVVNANIRPGERAIIISDNYQKPNSATQFYEDFMIQRLGDRAHNVMMAESTSSMFLQLVDVLLGCVMYHYKRRVLPLRNAVKDRLSNRLAAGYSNQNRTDLCGAWTCRQDPNYFSVWPFRPREPA